jgi:nucleotide-binding universal stress UspA family protein
MENGSMACIVCATRGGAGTRAVQRRAIEYASDSSAKLIFLYVSDTSSMGEIKDSLLPAIQAEMDWLGKALLRVAQKRAQGVGVASEIALRRGDVREEIGRFLAEQSADMLLLGAPRDTTTHIFGDDAIERFATSIQEQTGVKVEIVRPEESESQPK